MKNTKVIRESSGAWVVPIPGAPKHHGWAVRYVSGSTELDAVKSPLWITRFRPQHEVSFGENPWLWESEADANKIVGFLRREIEVETKAEYV